MSSLVGTGSWYYLLEQIYSAGRRPAISVWESPLPGACIKDRGKEWRICILAGLRLGTGSGSSIGLAVRFANDSSCTI